ncbi:hypothetical protein SAPIO_CDS9330 [Scedosporium apiospermum]|uniref:SH3 domain-containing protein n=1 Tax=Pseudallescheria apiosperma TaxID=563466 RepID=A0A084FWK3_PSEDA|nr:uncharacterized protein SAPIO_CDS9330 [Scedosporium apiospermum]KEZ39465.1 hypothetical protein SAPIO_CDS9330 [Scedosporium apiospermum]
MVRHLQTRHPGMVAESQMQTILDAFKRPVRHSKLLSCPLCDEWEPPDSLIDQGSPSRHYYRHLARHLQLLALESLPLSIEGLEINLPEEETDVEESEGESDSESLSESSRTVQCPTCHIRWYQDDGGTACHHCRAEGNASPEAPRRFSGLFRSALDLPSSSSVGDEDEPERIYIKNGYKVLWLGASLYSFNMSRTKYEAGYPFLTYQAGEIFDVIAEKGELWLAFNEDDPSEQVGWLWSKHFAKLADS